MKSGEFGYEEAIPEQHNLRVMFFDLCQDLLTAFAKFDTYQKLFGTEESLAILNETAPVAFVTIEESLRVDIIMSICRMSDHSVTNSQNNLSFKTLANAVNDADITSAVEQFVTVTVPLRRHRHKSHAHKAIEFVLDPVNNRLPQIDLKLIGDIFRLAISIVNAVSLKYGGAEFGFALPSIGDGRTLLNWLTESLSACKQRQAKLLSQL